MIKKWEIKTSPAPRFPDRKLLLMSSENRGDAEKLKKSFIGYVGVVFKNDSADFQWAAYVYGASANIETLINQELKDLSVGKAGSSEKKKPAPEKKDEFPKKAQKPDTKISANTDAAAAKKPVEPAKITKEVKPAAPEKGSSVPPPAIEQFEKKSSPDAKAAGGASELLETFDKASSGKKADKAAASAEDAAESPPAGAVPSAPVIEKFEQLTPDQSAKKPLTEPLVETFAGKDEPAVQKEEVAAEPEKTEPDPARKDAKPIDVLYLCPENGKDKAEIVKENIAKIVAEKNINFDFKSAGVVVYSAGASKESVMEEIVKYKFSFVLVVAPDAMGEELLREIKKKGFVPKVITEDNIDKKFRYLNLITDIVLSPRR